MSLELRSVSRRFGAQQALDRVSLCVQPGDCYGFIGHNGAGKTTTMRIALGLQRADAGVVLVDGFDARRFPREARARMGALIETPGFQGGWSGTKNLVELLRLQGFTRTDARREAGRWIERVDLASAGEKRVQAYSQGMRQRLGIAQALLGSPRYVLLDEPTNGLDPEGIHEVRELLRSLTGDGVTVLVSSHQLAELSEICNRIGVLRHGRLLVEAETRALLDAERKRWRLEVRDVDAARRILGEIGTIALAPERGALWLELGAMAPERLLRTLYERGLDVVSFAPREPSLEEIYLRFTGSGDAAVLPPDPRLVSPVLDRRPADLRAPKRPVARMTTFDLRRLTSGFGVVALCAAPALVGAIAMLHRAAQGSQDAEKVAGAKVFSTTDVTAFEAVGVALQAGLPVLGLLALALGSQSIAAELSRGTLRNVLLRPLTRLDAAAGKALALLAIVLAGYVFLAAVSLALAGAVFEFRDVSELLPNGQRFPLTPAAEIWPELWRALYSPLLPLAAYAGLGFLAGAIARTGAAALGLALSAGAILDVGRALVRGFGGGGALPSDYLPSPLSDTSFVRFYVDVSQGVSNASFAHAATAVVVPAAWALLTLALAARLLASRSVP